MKTLATKIWSRLTWKNARWFMVKNVQSWMIQGAIMGLLTLCGVGAIAAMVSAKVAAYVVFIGQCLLATKS